MKFTITYHRIVATHSPTNIQSTNSMYRRNLMKALALSPNTNMNPIEETKNKIFIE